MSRTLDAAVAEAFEASQVPCLKALVETPSHTHARGDVELAAAKLDRLAGELGLCVERHPDPDGRFADHRVYRTPATDPAERALALVGHVDTVFPRSLGFVAFSRDGDVIRGPGVLDMKSGLTAIFFALRALREVAPDAFARLKARVVVTSDEEVGSPSSRTLLGALAPLTHEALVFEAGRDHDQIVTRRKGGATWTLTVQGRSAHSGLNHHGGVNALHAMALIIPQLEALTDYQRGVTINCGLLQGGTAKNTVPAEAKLVFEARFETMEDARTTVAAVEALCADPLSALPGAPQRLHDVTLGLGGGMTRPPMEPVGATQQLRLRYEQAAAAVGLAIGEAPLQGGGSDANLLAAAGVPCIDGLGPYGKQFHRVEEWSLLSSLRMRTQALARFLHGVAM